MSSIRSPKKLIEVALPLDDINAEAAREKSIRHGHPSTLHLWWARRPLAAARAVIFAQMVNDPGGARGWQTGVTKAEAARKREELFQILRDLVKWENTNNQEVLERARKAIRESWRETCEWNKGKPGFDPEVLPAFHDPFAGGGALPLEAQRLGLESHASDLNPVAAMINKAMIEIPPRFADSRPVGPLPEAEQELNMTYEGPQGLAEDVRRYGYWMREEAKKRIGHLYPRVEIIAEMAKDRPGLQQYIGKKLTVIAWLWARTVKSPDPRYSHVDVPLVSSFVLSKKKGHEAYVQPVIDGDTYRFKVKVGIPPKGAECGTSLGRGASFRCIMSNSPMPSEHIYSEGKKHRMGEKLMAIVCDGGKGRVYLSPSCAQERFAMIHENYDIPATPLPANPRWFSPPAYGMTTYGDLFTPRQLVALNTFSDLVSEARAKIIADAKAAGMSDDGISLADGGRGATAYGDAIAVYLAFAVDKCTDYWSSICSWHNSCEKIRNTFGRQAIPMTWDYAEGNPFSACTGNWCAMVDWVWKAIANLPQKGTGHVFQADAQTQTISANKVISTDPPYYDNIGYADLSDFFYVWMRRSLRGIYPKLFATMAVPKAEELVATPYRHGSKEKAEAFFLDGMAEAMRNLAKQAHPAFPVTIYYAFKSSETSGSSTGNTGWETFLAALLKAGFVLTGTWPMRTELGNRMIGMGTNALASSIVLVCRRRDADAPTVGRREFLDELRNRMEDALKEMMGLEEEKSPVAPVDLAQAAIGPGMEVFSRYATVLNADGTPMTVHEAMVEINRQITEVLNPDGADFDAATLFCNEWFRQYGWNEGPYGTAEVLAKAKNTTVDNIRNAGVIHSAGGKVRLLDWKEYPGDYDPEKDKNRPVWEACHHVIRTLNHKGETDAGELLSYMLPQESGIRQLAYSLYTLNERANRAEEARPYNELIASWNQIMGIAMVAAERRRSDEAKRPKQQELF